MHFRCLITNNNNFQTFVYGRPIAFSKPVIFATGFMSFFSVVIALFKVKFTQFKFLRSTSSIKLTIYGAGLFQTR